MLLIDDLHDNHSAVLKEKKLPASMRQTCHLTSDSSLEELLRFGRSIGMRPEWLHNDHLDCNPMKRVRAISRGAVLVSSMELVCRIYSRRERFAEKGLTFYCICDQCPDDIPRKGSALRRP